MEQYITGITCRSVILESSFEAEESEPCGICDLCSPPPRPGRTDILALIGKGILASELQRIVPAAHKLHVRTLLEEMRASGDITFAEDRFYIGHNPNT